MTMALGTHVVKYVIEESSESYDMISVKLFEYQKLSNDLIIMNVNP